MESDKQDRFDAAQVVETFTELDHIIARLLKVPNKMDTTASVISVILAREIIENQRRSGEEINSLDISKRFNTSRTPAREALVILENEGLVNIEARKRPRVADLSEANLREIYELRAELYALVARKVAATRTDAQLELLEATLEQLRIDADGSARQYFLTNLVFHEQLATVSGDRTLKAAIDGLGLRVLRFRLLAIQQPGLQRRSYDDHRRLVQALHERDVDLAGSLNRSIVISALQRLTGDSAVDLG